MNVVSVIQIIPFTFTLFHLCPQFITIVAEKNFVSKGLTYTIFHTTRCLTLLVTLEILHQVLKFFHAQIPKKHSTVWDRDFHFSWNASVYITFWNSEIQN